MTVTAHHLVRKELPQIDNVGVVLSRLAPPQARRGDRTGQDEQLAFLRDRLAAARPGAWYTRAFRRWQRATPPTAWRRVLRFKTDGPLTVGMGEASPLENGLSLHATCGTPILPGSSLKGLCRSWCSRHFEDGPWAPGRDGFRTLFGTGGDDGEAGGVDFLDGLLEPNTGGFRLEVLTPHHGAYYREEGAPRGWEKLVPVHFLAVEGSFRVVLEGPPQWLEPAVEILVAALSREGVGSKTRAGHGRLSLVEEEKPAVPGPGGGPGDGGGAFARVLAAHENVQQVQDAVRAWVLRQPVALDDVAALPRDDAATCREVAAWLDTKANRKRWNKQLENAKKAAAAQAQLDFVNQWSTGS
ncbi:MAG: hypothetical protein D6798_15085 [Deltaproteobacteria bacterium]|nr:MAG: hypothetical protein D6798_15085 [Deltaproteobacteria bacterium]